MHRKLLIVILALLIGVHAQAAQIKHLRSLNAAAAVVNGGFFDGVTNPLPPIGGGLGWTVVLTGSSPNLTYQIQAQMTDGTWVPISPANGLSNGIGSTVILSGSFGSSAGQVFTFPGPMINMRVAITAYTSGTLTADIVVNF